MLSGKQEGILTVVATVFVGELTHHSKGVEIPFAVEPRMGESIDIRIPGFENDIRGLIGKVIHVTSVNGGEPGLYVVVIPGEI
jgi:hypothetical protein